MQEKIYKKKLFPPPSPETGGGRVGGGGGRGGGDGKEPGYASGPGNPGPDDVPACRGLGTQVPPGIGTHTLTQCIDWVNDLYCRP